MMIKYLISRPTPPILSSSSSPSLLSPITLVLRLLPLQSYSARRCCSCEAFVCVFVVFFPFLAAPSVGDRSGKALGRSIGLSFARMVGANKPNRSEEQSGTQEEQLQHAQQVRAYLDANAPRRKLKPARSDAAEVLSDAIGIAEAPSDPPERTKYLQLLATGVPLETRGSGDVSEDFTESEYYQYMAAIDKAHHTTGTGFIKVDKAPEGFHLSDANADAGHSQSHPLHPRCNPATNDWEPATNSTFVTSTKPSRSESTA